MDALAERFRIVRRRPTAGEPGPRPGPLSPEEARAAVNAIPARADLFDDARAARYYVLDAALEMAVNMALAVSAPLLVTGEPGTGKTQLAYFLAHYFGAPLFTFQVRSDSTAESLKYDYDAVAYLHAAQFPESPDAHPRRADYLERRALWLAFEHPGLSVLLIDEIDKAPRDFPNDLLHELSQHRFSHPFLPGVEIAPSSGRPPLVVITSNAERRLPEPFLRRCVFHHIALSEAVVLAAVRQRVDAGAFPGLSETTRQEALARFFDLRRADLRKPPSTGELLVWLTILSALGAQPGDLRDVRLWQIPALGALVKDKDDLEKLGQPR